MTKQTLDHRDSTRPMPDVAEALKPYGYEWLVSVTGIAGPGSLIVVFAGPGDFYTACLTHDCQVAWVMTCGGQEVDANSDDANELHRRSRDLFRRASGTPPPLCLIASENMPGPVSDRYKGPPDDGPYVPSWCYRNGPRMCQCGHHEGYHADNGTCLRERECKCAGLPAD